MELHLKKNNATELMFPMVDSATPESLKTGETVTDTVYYKDGTGAWTALAIIDIVTEIGTTGMYSIELTAAELNHDLIMVKVTAANSADSVIIIRTFARDIDDLTYPTVSGRSLDITAGGTAGIDWANIEAPTTLVDLAGTDINKVDTCTVNTDMRGTEGANTVVPDAAGIAPTVVEIRQEIDNNSVDLNDLTARLTAARAAKIDNLDAAVTSRQPSGNVTVGGYSVGQAPADGLLATPANKLATDVTGKVTVGVNSDKTGYSISGTKTTLDSMNDFDSTTEMVDIGKISGSAAAATNLGASAGTIIVGATIAGTLSTTEMTTDLAEPTDDHYKGRIIIWTSGVLKDQATEITGYIGGAGKFVYTAITEAPGAGDTFVVV